MSALVLLALIVISAFFSASEIALTASRRTRLQIEVEVADEVALRPLAAETAKARGGTGQLLMKAALPIGEASLVLARDLLADAELAARIERIPGIAAVRLGVADPPRLALVS